MPLRTARDVDQTDRVGDCMGRGCVRTGGLSCSKVPPSDRFEDRQRFFDQALGSLSPSLTGRKGARQPFSPSFALGPDRHWLPTHKVVPIAKARTLLACLTFFVAFAAFL